MTLYLSRLRLDPRNRVAAINLNRPYELHRTLLRAFPSADQGGPGRVLFRTEPMIRTRPTDAIVLVQSDKEPSWTQTDQKLTDLLAEPPGTRIFADTFEIGTVLRFRLRANPTVRRCRLSDGTRDERRNRPRHGLYREEDQVAWLVRQGKVHGFDLMASDATEWFDTEAPCALYDVLVRDEGTILTRKQTETGVSRHHSVLFEGRLRVTDTSAFSEALRSGIGPAKAFGFGLLSVAPVRS
jgi:CRISPR system Cascade subunit CasE